MTLKEIPDEIIGGDLKSHIPEQFALGRPENRIEKGFPEYDGIGHGNPRPVVPTLLDLDELDFAA
jgi:hypothetical protein